MCSLLSLSAQWHSQIRRTRVWTNQALCVVRKALASLKVLMAGGCTDLLLISQERKNLSSSDQDGSGRRDFWLQTIGLREVRQKP